jgi:Kef-type K+ transport system membrane component KefB/nucleotide-binding universal stress UspA family protein
MPVIAAIPEHAILLFLVQFAVILFTARVLGELVSRLGQPPVLGELLGGMLLGPSILGAWAPGVSAALFPPDQLSFHLLELASWLGMVFLLVIVGLEVDVRVVRKLGSSAFKVTTFGFLVTFVAGWWLAKFLPSHLMGPLKNRAILGVFMGTAMSITAIPVLAKILIDLGMMKRNFAITALGAALVEDLIGWVILSVVLDMARHGSGDLMTAGRSLAVTLLFLALAWFVARPVVVRLMRLVDARLRQPHRRLTVALLVTLACAATTQWIGIHAVYGAFVAGILLGQAARFNAEDREALEGLAFGVFTPVFFSFAGLKLNLHALHEWDILLIVLSVAVAGKLFGGYVGGRLGGFSRAESAALGVGMNARGAMELVLALLGLSAGIVSNQLYSIIVMMAVITTLMTPPLLRALARFIPLSADEAERLETTAREARSVFRKGDLKALLPTAGGPSAAGLLSFLGPLAAAKRLDLSAFMVREPGKSVKESLLRTLGWDPLSMDYQSAAQALARRAESFGLRLEPRIVTRPSCSDAVLAESEKGYDLIFVGTHTAEDPLGGSFLARVVAESPCHVALYRAGLAVPAGAFTKILLPTKGDPLFPFVLEFASLYAESVPEASITVLHAERGRRSGWNPFSLLLPEPAEAGAMAPMVATALQEHAAQTAGGGLRVAHKTVSGEGHVEPILREASEGRYDLLVLAGVKSMVRERLFFGHTVQELLRRAPCPVLVLTPARGGYAALGR